MVELALRGGIVADRLIGDHWASPSALAPRRSGRCVGRSSPAGETSSSSVAAPGFVEAGVHAEFPGLRLDWVTVTRRPARQPAGGDRGGCAALSNRYRGASVVAMRTQPIPHAYRAFFRQIGLDPDVDRIPSEQAAVERLMHGGFRSGGPIEDALLIALIETGVPVWALDADLVDAGGLGIRTTGRRRAARRRRARLSARRRSAGGRRRERIHGLLFGELAPGHGVSRAHATGSRCSRSASTGCRRSTSRRRCGSCASRCSAAC